MAEDILWPVGVGESARAKCSRLFQGLIVALKAIYHKTAQQPVHTLQKKIPHLPAIMKMKPPEKYCCVTARDSEKYR